MQKQKSPPDAPIPEFAPPLAEDTPFFDRSAKPRVERNRWFVITALLASGYLPLLITLMMLFPLKTVETYLVTKAPGGRAIVDGQPIGTWVPDQEMIGFFVNDWARSVWDINASTLARTTKQSAEMTVGNAIEQLKALRVKDNPFALLNEAPGLVRTYENVSINFINDNTAFLRFNTTTLRPGIESKVRTYALTATFTRIKPATKAESLRNPAGLFITNFSHSEETPQQ